ncbi:MAG: hypothetical protein JSR27_05910 [Proteobacteria bacterium]|nr:hypothetical protein [Pseudomonadota bacterium]
MAIAHLHIELVYCAPIHRVALRFSLLPAFSIIRDQEPAHPCADFKKAATPLGFDVFPTFSTSGSSAARFWERSGSFALLELPT